MTTYNPYWNDPCPNCGGPHFWQNCQNLTCDECGSQGGHWSSCSFYNPYWDDPCLNCGGPHHWQTCQNVTYNECGSQGGHWSSCSYYQNTSYDSWDANYCGETSSTFQSQEEEERVEQMIAQIMKNSNEISLNISKMDSQIMLFQEQIVRNESNFGKICIHEDENASNEENRTLELSENLTNVIWDDNEVSQNGDVENMEFLNLERIEPHSLHFSTLGMESESDIKLTNLWKEVLEECNDEVDENFMISSILNMDVDDEMSVVNCTHVLEEFGSNTWDHPPSLSEFVYSGEDFKSKKILEFECVGPHSLHFSTLCLVSDSNIAPTESREKVFVVKRNCYNLRFTPSMNCKDTSHLKAKKCKMKHFKLWSKILLSTPKEHNLLLDSKLGKRFMFTKWREKCISSNKKVRYDSRRLD